MKIVAVESFVLRAPLDAHFGSSQRWVESRSAMLVRIVAESGEVGWGEAYGPRVAETTSVAVQTALRPLLIGEDPRRIAFLQQRLYSAVRDSGQKGAMVAAISAVDVALWDLLGHVLGQPVYQLLGGAVRTSFPAYATGLYYPREGDAVDAAVAEASRYAEDGFRVIKLKGGLDIDLDLARLRAVRRAVGDDVGLAFDVNHALDVSTAIHYGRALEQEGALWFEEPVQPEDYAGYARVRAALGIAIAGGEAEYACFGFRELISRGCVDIAQPDVCSAGGLTEAQRIGALAHAWGIRCVPHVWGSVVALAAAAHFIAALPDPVASLAPPSPLLELDRSPSPLRDGLAPLPFDLHDGTLTLRGEPGLGVELDWASLTPFMVREFSFPADPR